MVWYGMVWYVCMYVCIYAGMHVRMMRLSASFGYTYTQASFPATKSGNLPKKHSRKKALALNPDDGHAKENMEAPRLEMGPKLLKPYVCPEP